MTKQLYLCRKIYGPVVQLNRTSDSGSESRGFESLRGHLVKPVYLGLACLLKKPSITTLHLDYESK